MRSMDDIVLWLFIAHGVLLLLSLVWQLNFWRNRCYAEDIIGNTIDTC
jgi:hypothetical protein